jgi:hypothetical protein
MLNYRKTFVVFLLTVALAGSPLATLAEKKYVKDPYAEQNDPMAMTMDLIIARPMGLVATLAGTLVFVISVPFSALGGNTGESWDSLVASPAEYTFKRPLGQFD